MFSVTYNTCCCECTNINEIKNLITVRESVDQYLKMTEYEFQPILENWMEGLDSSCDFCGSRNISGENIQINNSSLYNFDSIVEYIKDHNHSQNFLIFSLLKTRSGTNREIGGKESNDINFILECYTKIIDVINNIPSKRFVKNNNSGQFLISITGEIQEIKIQNMRICGFDKSELVKKVNEYFAY